MTNKLVATRDEIISELEGMSRSPFLHVLADILECKPDLEEMQAFANKNPDRWAQAVSVFARLSGFHDKLDITHNVHVRITQMGDAELLQRLEELQREMIDVTPTELDEAEQSGALKKYSTDLNVRQGRNSDYRKGERPPLPI